MYCTAFAFPRNGVNHEGVQEHRRQDHDGPRFRAPVCRSAGAAVLSAFARRGRGGPGRVSGPLERRHLVFARLHVPLLPSLHGQRTSRVWGTPGRRDGGDPGGPRSPRERPTVLRRRDPAVPLRLRSGQAALRGLRAGRTARARGDPHRGRQLRVRVHARRLRQPDPRCMVRRHEPQLSAAPSPSRHDCARAGHLPHRQGGRDPLSHHRWPDRSRSRRSPVRRARARLLCGHPGARVSQAERLTRVSEILVELFRSPVPTHFFQTLGDRAGEAVPSHYLAVCLQDPEKSGYLVHSLGSLDEGAPAQRVFSLDEGLPGRAMSTGKPYLIDELMADDGVDDLEGVLAAAGLRAVLVVPIRRGLEVLGALLFAARPPIRYGDDDLQIAQLLASGLSAALETSLAYQAASDERSTLGAVLASTADAVIMQNPAGLILLANAAVRSMLGLAPEALAGRPLLEMIEYAPLRDLFVAG